MLYYALVFFVLAIVAGVLGLGVLAGTLALVAKVFFFLFIVAFILALIQHRRVTVDL